MRVTLVAWCVQVHLKFNLEPETLYITANLIDRYTARMPVKRTEYQLLGVTCMLIASKYQEINPPVVDDFTYITDNSYTRD
jgi:G2/mitotic-specific cyclin-B, other